MLRLAHFTLLLTALLLGACSLTPQHRADGASRAPGAAAKQANQTGDEVALRAVSMLGKPYQWGGNSPRAGFDCSGLAHYAWRTAAGIKLPRTARGMSRAGQRVSQKRLLPGDLVFFNTQRRRYSHVGIYVGGGRFVHAPSKGKNIRLARLTNPYWSKRYNGARRPGQTQ
ncbi:MAG: C40 family peptidase [Burkholderiaceae bacterium]